MHTVHCQEQDGYRCDVKMSIGQQFIFPHLKYFASFFLNVFVQNCIRDITDALIAMCEDRQEDEETAMLSNSQIIHSVIDIFGAGKRPTVKRMNVHNIILLEVEQKNGFLSTYPEL